MTTLRRVTGLAGLAGGVLFLFGATSYAVTRRFDLWTAIHFTGGGILLAVGLAANLAGARTAMSSRAGRFRIRSAAGALCLAAVLIAANVWIDRLDIAWDVTERRVFTLSPEAHAELAGVPDGIRITAFWSRGDAERADAERVLEQIRDRAPGTETRIVDASARPELAAAYDVRRDRTVLAETATRDARIELEPGEIGEWAVLALMRQVTRTGPTVVFVSTGNGEVDPYDAASPDGGALLAKTWADAGFRIVAGALADLPDSGKEVAFVAVLGPARALADADRERVVSWLDAGGSALFLIEPGIDGPLSEALSRRGARPGSDVVVDPARGPALAAIAGVDILAGDFADHAAVAGMSAPVRFRVAQSVRASAMASATVLARSAPTAWAETDVEALVRDGRASRDPEDRPGPVPLAVAVDHPDSGSRLIVVGDADFARNARVAAFGNRRFAVGLARWLSHEQSAVAAGPRRLRASRLDLTEEAYRAWFRFAVVLVPEAVLLVGLGVWWWRRSL